jgi:hypothetical protein
MNNEGNGVNPLFFEKNAVFLCYLAKQAFFPIDSVDPRKVHDCSRFLNFLPDFDVLFPPLILLATHLSLDIPRNRAPSLLEPLNGFKRRSQ